MSLRKQFSRGLRIEDEEDSDDSTAGNPEKEAYDRRVRRFTKPPPALQPKTSLTFYDQKKMGILQPKHPKPSGLISQKASSRKKEGFRRNRSRERIGEPMVRLRKQLQRKPLVPEEMDEVGFSSGNDYYYLGKFCS